MFGISWAEFFVIILVAVLVIPARLWPDVMRFVARLINAIRRIVWKITDVSENIKQQIDLEKPMDELFQTTTDDVLDGISDVLPVKKKAKKKIVRKKAKK